MIRLNESNWPLPTLWTVAAGLVLIATAWTAHAASRVPAETVLNDAPTGPTQNDIVSANSLKFDVISIKPDKSGSGNLTSKNTADGLQLLGFTAQMLIRAAYGFDDNLIFGAPGWLNSDPYTLEAKVADSDVPAFSRLDPSQRNLMLQPVLTDRFQLKFHREIRQFPIYSLVPAKSGVTFKKSSPADSTAPQFRMESGQVICQRCSMKFFSQWLTLHVGRRIVDNTGLADTYDLILQWSPGSAAANEPDSSPSIFTAIQEQLGLKLAPEKGPVETFVIDHVERPSEN